MRVLLTLILCLIPAATIAEELMVREVTILPAAPLSRLSTQADPIERALADGTWQPPAVSASLQRLTADADGWIRDDALFEGYAYANVPVQEDSTWLLDAMGYGEVWINGELRVGNLYGYKDEWESWEPASDFSLLPVRLRAGDNHFLFLRNRHGLLRARLTPATRDLQLNAKDFTFPDLVVDETANTWASLVVINATADPRLGVELEAQLEGGLPVKVTLPALPPFGVRKVAVPVRGMPPQEPGERVLRVTLMSSGQTVDEVHLPLTVKESHENRRVTFHSAIDGSIQYYGYLPATNADDPKALVLSLHGASVEAINQSGSYAPLSWGHILAPTNRRPFGFSWEDWGRLDALEVLEIGLGQLDIDRDRVYLTGHSMGGHGSWQLGSLYPDRFAAIGPSAGWISVWSYREDPPTDPATDLTQMVDRATLPSQTLELAPNLAGLGVYILHGSEDDNVPPQQSYLMLEQLEQFHRDFVYFEQPGAGHWWDLSDGPGADCVAWAPMFDFLARHRRPRSEEVRHIRFRTPSPSVSAWNHWAGILTQHHPFAMSAVDLQLDPLAATLTGITDNVEALALDLTHTVGDTLHLELDTDTFSTAIPADRRLLLERSSGWHAMGGLRAGDKNPERTGTFREAFGNFTQLVYATGGTPEENAWALAKARYDAEVLWYQGNASVNVIPDRMYHPGDDPDRNVVLYGNADTHGDWATLWTGPVEVERGAVRVGDHTFPGDGVGILAVRPRPGSDRATVGIVAGSGLAGSRLLDNRPYLRLGISYPDVTVFEDGGEASVVRAAGFFGNDWSVGNGEFVWTP